MSYTMGQIIFEHRELLELWKLAGVIGSRAESNYKYESVYKLLSDALDEAEARGLIIYPDFE